ncbi:hypothetical protein IJ670_02525, partial [bacterium]|nr:hypothetical protein [bacterium]
MSNIPEGNSLYWAQVIYGKNPEGKSLDMTKDENIEIFQKLWDDNANSISTLSINNARRQAGLEADKSLEDIASLDGFRNDISFEDVAKIQLGFDILTWYFNENPKGKLEYSNGTYLTKEAFSIDNANGVLDFVAERGAIEELLNSYIEANPNSKFAQLYKENLSSALTNYGKTLV